MAWPVLAGVYTSTDDEWRGHRASVWLPINVFVPDRVASSVAPLGSEWFSAAPRGTVWLTVAASDDVRCLRTGFCYDICRPVVV